MDRSDLYFAALASWLYHPGYQREGTKTPTLEQIANMVDEMLVVSANRWPDKE